MRIAAPLPCATPTAFPLLRPTDGSHQASPESNISKGMYLLARSRTCRGLDLRDDRQNYAPRDGSTMSLRGCFGELYMVQKRATKPDHDRDMLRQIIERRLRLSGDLASLCLDGLGFSTSDFATRRHAKGPRTGCLYKYLRCHTCSPIRWSTRCQTIPTSRTPSNSQPS